MSESSQNPCKVAKYCVAPIYREETEAQSQALTCVQSSQQVNRRVINSTCLHQVTSQLPLFQN